MRRPAPRPVGDALEAFRREAAPATVLARVQEAWPGAVGAVMAREAEPVAEHAGRLTVSCRSATWAHELSLLAPELVARLNGVLDPAGEGPLRELRTSTAGPPRRGSGRP